MKKAEPEIEKTQPPPPKAAETAAGPAAEPLVPVEPSTITSAQLEELKTRAAKADEYWDRLLRTAAEFDNFKKRAARDKQAAVQYGNNALMEKLLTVLDHFDMALAAAKNGSGGAAQSLQTGIMMIYQQLKSTLAEAGLQEVDATGQKFDPNWHEAVAQQETTEAPEGQVVQQLRKGYRLHDRLLRAASVVVAKSPAPNAKNPQ